MPSRLCACVDALHSLGVEVFRSGVLPFDAANIGGGRALAVGDLCHAPVLCLAGGWQDWCWCWFDAVEAVLNVCVLVDFR